MQKVTRRSFLKKTGAGSALVAGSILNWNPRAVGANEKVVLGLVGGRNRGSQVGLLAIRRGGAEIKTFCDIDQAILDKVNPDLEGAQNKRPETTKEFRRLLDDKEIDGVIIATPDHWHTHMALLACQAGKDVYIEKPLTQTIQEGHLIRDAARKYNRVVQVGTQNRSARQFQSAVEYVKSGKLGKICQVSAWECQVRESIGNPPDSDPPPTVDYDVWLGPAPKRPFNINRFHYNWRFFWDYGNSEQGNQGVHMLDVALWGIQQFRGLENCLPTHVSGTSGIYWLKDAKEIPDTQVLTYDYGDFMLVWDLCSYARHHPIDGSREGISFKGTEGTLMVHGAGYRGNWKVYHKDGSVGPEVGPADESEEGLHEKNFVDCIKSRKRPNADVEVGRLSTTICHLGNICCHLRRDINFDPRTETFGSDKEANTYLTKDYRSTYPLPKV
jgi:predicted dehydrogenase